MEAKEIKERVRQFILSGDESEEAFSEVALAVFSHQYRNNRFLRRYYRKRRVSPATVSHYTEIPPIPVAAFKEATFSCCPPEEAEAVFMTSGTTNPEKRGKNYHRDLEIYDLSMKTHFKACILPDTEQIKMAVLFPAEQQMPNSSLAHYLHLAYQTYGAEGSAYFVGEEGFDIPGLITFIRQAEETDEPVLLIGATFSFIQFLDYCLEEGLRFSLPSGSRLMDTGGSKGRTREMEPAQFKEEMSRLFTLPIHACLNMYGMTELSTQVYDGRYAADQEKTGDRERVAMHTLTPHWMRTRVIDPETMQVRPEGEQGVLVHYDVANINSVLAIMTEDLGIAQERGFHLLGRVSGAEAKGCSLAVEQFLAATQGERS